MITFLFYIVVLLASVAVGYFCCKGFFFFLLPFFQKRDLLNQRKEMLSEALRQRDRILEEQGRLQDTNIQLLKEDLEDEISLKEEGFKQQEEDLDLKSQRDVEFETKIAEREEEVDLYKSKVKDGSEVLSQTKLAFEEDSERVLQRMSQVALTDPVALLEKTKKKLLDEKQVECKQISKHDFEVVNSIANKKAHRMLDRVLSRYSPEFYWPKPINLIEVARPEHFEQLNESSSSLLEGLSEHSGVSISLMSDEDKPNNHAIKVVGGYGIAKEASRLSLEKLLGEGSVPSWRHLRRVYEGNFEKLTAEAVVLGKQAVDQLGLKGIHPELQKLVGALNWRTSYRQNQWYHTVEVATLAGILAHELGEDPDAAKRVGLLHDVGKVLDYKINASHAVISGDYADRYGEQRLVCDTVMSHHADLIMETPLAYILQTADCLSGARPGARVNLEEGYQIRLSAIQEAVHSFPGVADIAIMNGGREVHVQVINRKVSEKDLPDLAKNIAQKIEEMVNYPGKIKVMVTRTFESVKVA